MNFAEDMPLPPELVAEVMLCMDRKERVRVVRSSKKLHSYAKRNLGQVYSIPLNAVLRAAENASYRLGPALLDSNASSADLMQTLAETRWNRQSGGPIVAYSAFLVTIRDASIVRMQDGRLLASVGQTILGGHSLDHCSVYVVELPKSCEDVYDILRQSLITQVPLRTSARIYAFALSFHNALLLTLEGPEGIRLTSTSRTPGVAWHDALIALPWPVDIRGLQSSDLTISGSNALATFKEPPRFALYNWKESRLVCSGGPELTNPHATFSCLGALTFDVYTAVDLGPTQSSLRLFQLSGLSASELPSAAQTVNLGLPIPGATSVYTSIQFYTSMGSGGLSADIISLGRLGVLVCDVYCELTTSTYTFLVFFRTDVVADCLRVHNPGEVTVWEEWGPGVCRVIYLGPFPKVYKNTLCGLRVVVRQQLTSNHHWHGRYRDVYFNFGDTVSLFGIGAGPENITTNAGSVLDPSHISIPGVFAEPVMSSLPYAFSTGDETFIWSFQNAPELLMDDSRVLELAPRDEDEDPAGEVIDIDVHDF